MSELRWNRRPSAFNSLLNENVHVIIISKILSPSSPLDPWNETKQEPTGYGWGIPGNSEAGGIKDESTAVKDRWNGKKPEPPNCWGIPGNLDAEERKL